MPENTTAMVQRELEKYEVGEVELATLAGEVAPLLDLDITDRQAYKQLAAGLQRVVKTRTSIEARRKELKAPVLEIGKAIDAEGKRLGAIVYKIEAPLAAKKNSFDTEKERPARELQNRIETLRNIPVMIQGESLSNLQDHLKALQADEITEAEFGKRFDEIMKLKIAGLIAIEAAIRKAEEAEKERLRLQYQEAEQKAEAKRLREKEEELALREAALNEKENPEKKSSAGEGFFESDKTDEREPDANCATAENFLHWIAEYIAANNAEVYADVTFAQRLSTGLDAPEAWRI